MSIITIDCGASFIKASRVENGNVTESISKNTPADNDEKKLQLSVKIIKDMISYLADDNEIHVGLSNEMHGFVLTDENGNLVTNYISWQCEYANETYDGENTYLDILKKQIDTDFIYRTGMPLKVGIPSTNMFYLLKNSKLEKGKKYYFYTLGDYYIRTLSGKEPCIHITNAAATGLFDIVSNKWSKDIIEKICPAVYEIEIVFPEIYEAQSPKKCFFEDRTIYYYPALGDQQAALLGAGVKKAGDVSFNFGTGAQISVAKTEINLSDNYQTRPFFYGLYLRTVPHIPSGRALNVYYNFIKEIISEYSDISDEEIWNYINSKANINNKKHMEIDLSFFTNAVSNRTSGKIDRITESGFTLGNLFDSVYEQMANNVEYICKKLEIFTFERLIISGGILIKNEILRKYVLDRFSNTYEMILAEKETAKGISMFVMEIINENKGI